MLPIVEFLYEFESDDKRADWLLRVPDGVIMRDGAQIESILRQADFVAGSVFLALRRASLDATRTPDGELPFPLRRSLEMARSNMRAVALADRSAGGLQ